MLILILVTLLALIVVVVSIILLFKQKIKSLKLNSTTSFPLLKSLSSPFYTTGGKRKTKDDDNPAKKKKSLKPYHHHLYARARPQSPLAQAMWDMISSFQTTRDQIQRWIIVKIEDLKVLIRRHNFFSFDFEEFSIIFIELVERIKRRCDQEEDLACPTYGSDYFDRVKVIIREESIDMLRKGLESKYTDLLSFNYVVIIFIVEALTSSSPKVKDILIKMIDEYILIIILEYILELQLDPTIRLALSLAFTEFTASTLLHDHTLYLSKLLSNFFVQISQLFQTDSSSSFLDCLNIVRRNYGDFFLWFVPTREVSDICRKQKATALFQKLNSIAEKFLEFFRSSINSSTILSQALFYLILEIIDPLIVADKLNEYELALSRIFIFLTYEIFSLYGISYNSLIVTSSIIEETLSHQSNFYYSAAIGENIDIINTSRELFEGKDQHLVDRLDQESDVVSKSQTLNVLRFLSTPINIYEKINHITSPSPACKESIFPLLMIKSPFLNHDDMNQWIDFKSVGYSYISIFE